MDLAEWELPSPDPSRHPVFLSISSPPRQIPALVWTTDRGSALASVREAGLRAGCDLESYLGRPIEELFSVSSPITGGIAKEAHRTALRGSAAVFRGDLAGREFEAQVEPVLDAEGAVSGVRGLAVDVTDRVVTEAAVRLSERSYRSLIEEAPYAICRATVSGQLLQVNLGMVEMLGYDSEADVLVSDLSTIFGRPEELEQFRAALLSSTTIRGFDAVWIGRDQQEVSVRLGGRTIRNAAGDVLYFDLLAEDVTGRKQLELRLNQAQRMQVIGQLAGAIAHDFNNLLTVINGYSEMLMKPDTAEPFRRRGLEMIRQAGERAANLTQQLLVFSRQQVTEIKPLSINAVVAEVLPVSRHLVGDRIQLTESLDEASGLALADVAQLRHLLLTLIMNAQDAMPNGGRIHIATAAAQINVELGNQLDVAPGDYVLLTVGDTGVGMDERVRAHLFEPFFTTKPAGQGAGLGLATVHGIVRQARGAIVADSAPGAGTTFRIYFPAAGPTTGGKSPGTHAVPSNRESRTIVVVEDDPAVRRFVVEVLATAGYQILEAAHADEALRLTADFQKPIHLLMTDMMLPGLNGRQLAERLHRLHPETKVLLASGYSEILKAQAPLEANITYLQKPFSSEQLTRKVSEMLAQRETC